MRQDLTYAVRGLLRRPVFTSVVVADAGARDWRQRGDFLRRQCGPASSASLPKPGSADDAVDLQPATGFRQGCRDLSELRRLAAARTRRSRRLAAYTGAQLHVDRRPATRRRSGAPSSRRDSSRRWASRRRARPRRSAPREARRAARRHDPRATGLWQTAISAAMPAIVGRMVMLNSVSHEVLGVMPDVLRASGNGGRVDAARAIRAACPDSCSHAPGSGCTVVGRLEAHAIDAPRRAERTWT